MDFKSTVAEHKGAFVTFYAKWCSYCKKFKPELKAAALRLKKSNPDILIASVNAPQNGYTARQYRVQSYPTIKWFENGVEKQTYRLRREQNAVIQFVQQKASQLAPPTNFTFSNSFTEITSKSNFTTLIDTNEFLLVAWCGKNLNSCQRVIPSLNEATEMLNKEKIKYVYAKKLPGVSSGYGVKQTPTVQMFIDGGHHTYTGEMRKDKVFAWVKAKTEWWASLNDGDDDDKFFG